jgi:hypothetical protein
VSLRKNVIACASKSGLRPTLFFPCNSPTTAMYSFIKIVVEIAARSQILILRDPPQSMVVLPLRDFGLLNQINGPLTPFSIDDRDLFSDLRTFPPPLSSGDLDLAPRVHLHIDDSRDSDFWASKISNVKTSPSSIRQSSRVDDLRTPVLLNQRPCFYFGCLIFQLDQWSCGPLLDQWSRSPLGLRTSEISNLKLRFPSKYVDSCRVSS